MSRKIVNMVLSRERAIIIYIMRYVSCNSDLDNSFVTILLIIKIFKSANNSTWSGYGCAIYCFLNIIETCLNHSDYKHLNSLYYFVTKYLGPTQTF